MRAELATGTIVRVRTDRPIGHCRTPFYLRGHIGTIERFVGLYRNPQQLAVHKPGLPKYRLYRVRFRQTEIWPNYSGSPTDELIADLYEHWLDRFEGASSHAA
ncbi:MAG: SH3-like domain-containing protein [Alphaproteobacteria bacterium]